MSARVLGLGLALLTCVSTSTSEGGEAAQPVELTQPVEARADARASEPAATEPPPRGAPGQSLGPSRLTYYWLAHEPEHAPNTPLVSVQTCAGVALAEVPASFAKALRLEGSGKLRDGRVLNIGACSCKGTYACFVELDAATYPWGQGSRGNALQPYRSIATDAAVIAYGTWLYAPALDGLRLPGGETHDGCLRAADVGGGIEGAHIDWFVGLKDNYRALAASVPDDVELFAAGERCGA